MAMTLKVYEVNRNGGIRVVREKVKVDPLPHTEPTSAYPACTCPKCEGRNQ